jgi:hypothetical protein
MSYFRSGDPLDDFARRDREQSKWLRSRPTCSCCGQHIQEERLLHIEGEFYHFSCAVETFGADTEDFM